MRCHEWCPFDPARLFAAGPTNVRRLVGKQLQLWSDRLPGQTVLRLQLRAVVRPARAPFCQRLQSECRFHGAPVHWDKCSSGIPLCIGQHAVSNVELVEPVALLFGNDGGNANVAKESRFFVRETGKFVEQPKCRFAMGCTSHWPPPQVKARNLTSHRQRQAIARRN